MKALLVLVGLLLVAVPAAASHGDSFQAAQEVVSRETTVAVGSSVYASVAWNNQARTLLTLTVGEQGTRDVVHRNVAIEVAATLSMTHSSTGTGSVVLRSNGVSIASCSQAEQTFAPPLGGQNIPEAVHFLFHCALPDVDVDEVFVIDAFFSTVGGSPPTINRFNFAIKATQIDYEVASMQTDFEAFTGLTATEFLIFPALAFVGVFLWSRQDFGIRLFGIFLVAFDLALVFSFYAASGGSWPGLLVMVFVLLLLMTWMSVNLARDQGKKRLVPT